MRTGTVFVTNVKGSTILNTDTLIEIQPLKGPESAARVERLTGKLNIEEKLGIFQLDSVFAPAFSFHQAKLSFRYETLLRANESPKNRFGLAVILEGRGDATFGDTEVQAIAGQSVFTYNAGLNEKHVFHAHESTRVMYFEVSPEYFFHTFLDDDLQTNISLQKLRDRLERNEFVVHNASTSALQKRIIHDINQCPLGGSLGKLMLEASLQQMFALQLADMMKEQRRQSRLGARDREIIHAVKHHLQSTFQEDHSLLELSRKFGLNQNKLKTGFREEFGVPVIEYLFQLKMDHAKMLLSHHGVNVSEAACAVGYRHAHHFATAFKRKFGFSPSTLRV